MEVTEALVRHVARLARIELTGAEVAAMVPQLSRILGYVEAVSAAKGLAADPAAAEAVPVAALRTDVPAPCLTRAEALSNAPEHDQVFFLVPRVLGDD